MQIMPTILACINQIGREQSHVKWFVLDAMQKSMFSSMGCTSACSPFETLPDASKRPIQICFWMTLKLAWNITVQPWVTHSMGKSPRCGHRRSIIWDAQAGKKISHFGLYTWRTVEVWHGYKLWILGVMFFVVNSNYHAKGRSSNKKCSFPWFALNGILLRDFFHTCRSMSSGWIFQWFQNKKGSAWENVKVQQKF